ncbi:MBL fold metallo-hydrolase RNA specificity domain-containing protein [Spiribacter halobius]|uniref:MBL fold metallo-hydrolase n=1 Tax=Sediminicurvatus halobius TaxID=2182432 RepID=A0A2U2N5J9_9GAMM|nr:MBL fold metallo-hydrolase [Spiribacter halobius]PWG64372.1 MBL fold metallo-hydrolase [Spiribacter halobius]UEX79280.1 MBL fold metallo-hydrolase [Spiribacter halobius]
MHITFLGATREVTGSCHLLEVGGRRVLVDCGLIQGSPHHERHNHDPFTFDPAGLDAVLLTHAHLDHSGRLPLLLRQGFQGRIITHPATVDLCRIMLEDAGYLNEKEAEWQNRKRRRKGLELVKPLYTRAEARATAARFDPLEYGEPCAVAPGITATFHDAGHILGSAVIALDLEEAGRRRRVVMSGDLGHRGTPVLRDPEPLTEADLVVMESTYGDRDHRPWDATWEEMGRILSDAREAGGNLLVPAFAVDRTQMLLYAFRSHFAEWGLGDWEIFLDSPMAIAATRVYARHTALYDSRASAFERRHGGLFELPNLHLSERTEDSMAINRIRSGAVVIAGSGMCDGGRIRHHLKHNVWRRDAHVLISGFQAAGTTGRALVDGARHIRLWGETIRVQAQVHTVNGLSAHADQAGLLEWYANFRDAPPVAVVHGEPRAQDAFVARLRADFGTRAQAMRYGETVDLERPRLERPES